MKQKKRTLPKGIQSTPDGWRMSPRIRAADAPVGDRGRVMSKRIADPDHELDMRTLRDRLGEWKVEARGSADAKGIVRFNWRIIQAPTRLIDYVVAHELGPPRVSGPHARLLGDARRGNAGLRGAAGGVASAGASDRVVT